ncbi:MAG: 2-hydroxyacid dehydrogenase [Candidatus Spyradocola sp.]
MKIVLLESLGIPCELLDSYAARLAAAGHEFDAYERNTDPQVQIERAKDADVIMIANMPLKGEVIRACRKLKFIDVAFTGVDHVDLIAAREMGVKVSNASGYSTQSVAELALGMMLALLRNVPQVDARCREGKTKDGLVGTELRGKTVGIVGAGAIGQNTARLCKAFGCRVIAYNHRPKQVEEGLLEFVDLDTLTREADIISLNCPLTAETRGMFDAKRIAMMKKTALLINVARGPVVDSQALADALNEGRIAGAGIDVFEVEPPLATDHPLLHTPNTIVTPHVAFASKESMALRAEIVFDSLDKFMAGNQVNVIL